MRQRNIDNHKTSVIGGLHLISIGLGGARSHLEQEPYDITAALVCLNEAVQGLHKAAEAVGLRVVAGNSAPWGYFLNEQALAGGEAWQPTDY